MQLTAESTVRLKLMYSRHFPSSLLFAMLAVAVSALAKTPEVKWHPGDYAFVQFGKLDDSHLCKNFRGIQKTYSWRSLEPVKEIYQFGRDQLHLNYIFWGARAGYFEKVQAMLAEPSFPKNPAGGLNATRPKCLVETASR